MKFKWLIAFIFLCATCSAAPLHVTFISPSKQNDPFWLLVINVTQSVADDLDIKLDVKAINNDRFSSIESIKSISKLTIKPDYIIYHPMHGNAVATLDILEASNIRFVTLEQDFSSAELKTIGQPQQKYKQWLGSVTYDDEAGGALLASALYQQHLKNNLNKKMQITAIGGNLGPVSLARQAGLAKVAKGNDNIMINQIFPMFWLVGNLQASFPFIHRRYPDTNAYWGAADLYSLNIIEQLKQLAPADKPRAVIGGFDWLPAALDKIETGEITASVGGHMLMGAKALLNIVEYHNGNNVFLTKTAPQKYELINQDNIAIYQAFLKKVPWPEIDFRQFSSVYNQQRKPVDLTMASLLEAYSKLNQPIEPATPSLGADKIAPSNAETSSEY